MMDPATVGLIVRGLDVGFSLATYYLNRAESEREKSVILNQLVQIQTTKDRLQEQGVTPEEAARLLDKLASYALEPLRTAMNRL